MTAATIFAALLVVAFVVSLVLDARGHLSDRSTKEMSDEEYDRIGRNW
jgi:hypothetical protein